MPSTTINAESNLPSPAAPTAPGNIANDHCIDFNAPSVLSGFDGFPFAIGHDGVYDPKKRKRIGSHDGSTCSREVLRANCQDNYPAFWRAGEREWTWVDLERKVAEEVRSIQSAIEVNAQLKWDYMRPGEETRYMCSGCGALDKWKYNLTNTKRHRTCHGANPERKITLEALYISSSYRPVLRKHLQGEPPARLLVDQAASIGAPAAAADRIGSQPVQEAPSMQVNPPAAKAAATKAAVVKAAKEAAVATQAVVSAPFAASSAAAARKTAAVKAAKVAAVAAQAVANAPRDPCVHARAAAVSFCAASSLMALFLAKSNRGHVEEDRGGHPLSLPKVPLPIHADEEESVQEVDSQKRKRGGAVSKTNAEAANIQGEAEAEAEVEVYCDYDGNGDYHANNSEVSEQGEIKDDSNNEESMDSCSHSKNISISSNFDDDASDDDSGDADEKSYQGSCDGEGGADTKRPKNEMKRSTRKSQWLRGVLNQGNEIDLSGKNDMVVEPDGSGIALQNQIDQRNEYDRKLKKVKTEKDAAEESLVKAKEDVEDANELVHQQAVFTDKWQGKFDDVAKLAQEAGVDIQQINKIRYS